MRLLYAQDGTRASEHLIERLADHGMHVDRGSGGGTSLDPHVSTYDLIIADLDLNGDDGRSLLKQIQACERTRVLFLTESGGREAELRGNVVAEDCLARPFVFPELLARVGAIVSRREKCDSDILRMADLEVHVLRRRVERGGRRIDLTGREYGLLLLLMSCRGQAISRAMIAEQMSDAKRRCNANSVELLVGRLRRKIDAQFAQKLVHTVRGEGYLMDAREQWEIRGRTCASA